MTPIEPLSAGHERIVPLVTQYCQDCHAGDVKEGDIDLSGVGSLDAVRQQVKVWQRVAEMVASRQMPPPEADQPTDDERAEIGQWLHEFLKAEARARAGDPGRVVLRRLNNAEYTYTIRDLTGVDSLDPAKEFPADGGAGEGFTNTGQSLVMSPALVTKYFDAAKTVAGHAVLLPDGFRFSAGDTRRDWTDERSPASGSFMGGSRSRSTPLRLQPRRSWSKGSVSTRATRDFCRLRNTCSRHSPNGIASRRVAKRSQRWPANRA